MASDVPDVYADGVQLGVNAFGVSLAFSASSTTKGAEARPVAIIRTSLEHAKAMAIILRKQLKNYEDGNGAPIHLHPSAWKSLGLSKHDDW
jgi:hypothetical protein